MKRMLAILGLMALCLFSYLSFVIVYQIYTARKKKEYYGHRDT